MCARDKKQPMKTSDVDFNRLEKKKKKPQKNLGGGAATTPSPEYVREFIRN